MIKILFLVKRKAGMSVAEYQQYSTETHAPIVAGLPGLRRYVVNYVAEADEAAFDGVIELGFDSQADFEAALASEAGQAALADQPNFLSPARTVMLVTQEQVLV